VTSHFRSRAIIVDNAYQQFFKILTASLPLTVKQDVTLKCTEFACRDLRPFKTVAGDGFVALAQAFISLGVKYGQVSRKDVLPHPTTILWRTSDVAAKIRHDVVIPDIGNCYNKWGIQSQCAWLLVGNDKTNTPVDQCPTTNNYESGVDIGAYIAFSDKSIT